MWNLELLSTELEIELGCGGTEGEERNEGNGMKELFVYYSFIHNRNYARNCCGC